MVARKKRTGPQPIMGRPSLPPEERHRNRVVLNLDDAEYQVLVDAAGDTPPSTFARRELVRLLARRGRR